jgi:hypothetical protein
MHAERGGGGVVIVSVNCVAFLFFSSVLATSTGLGYPLIKMVMETTETERNLKKSPGKKTNKNWAVSPFFFCSSRSRRNCQSKKAKEKTEMIIVKS